MEHDIIVIGCGLCGSVIGRFAAQELGLNVLILERRDHIAGNMYDYTDESGVRIQKYGPHIFHTYQKHLFDYVNKFGHWNDYRLTYLAQIDGIFTPTPFNFKTIDQFHTPDKARKLKERLEKQFPDTDHETIVNLLSHPDSLISKYASFLFEKDYRPYTAKQWGISPEEIDISVLQRVPVRFSYDDGYFDDTYQALPQDGFTSIFENMLNHENITLSLNTDANSLLELDTEGMRVRFKGLNTKIPIVYTGALDALMNYRFGPLPYRSLRFDFKTDETTSYQPAPIVAYPQAEGYTRITEYTKLPYQDIPNRTVISVEYPLSYVPMANMEPYYPVLTEGSQSLYNRYRSSISPIDNIFLCGRLADFKYYNMDQALERALDMCKIIGKWHKKQTV